MSNEESKFPNGFQGIVITGWSRYDHFAVLAELLPASMPSLATNLISVSHGYFNASWQKELYQSLQCADNSRLYEEFIDLESDPTLHEKMSWCFFTGIINFRFLKTETNLKGLYNVWVTDIGPTFEYINEYGFPSTGPGSRVRKWVGPILLTHTVVQAFLDLHEGSGEWKVKSS